MCAYPGCNATSAEAKIIKTCSEMTQEIVVASEGPPLLCQRHYQHVKVGLWLCLLNVVPYLQCRSMHLSVQYCTLEGKYRVWREKSRMKTRFVCHATSLTCPYYTSSSISRAALEHDINTWKQQLQNCEDTLTIALLTAVLLVTIELLQERTLLLPQACTMFLSKYGAVNNPSQLYLEVEDSEVQFSSRWLLHQLIVYLHSYMRCKCIHKRFGVILY